MTAPLALLVAIAAHAIGFGGNHALGGSYAEWLIAAGFGGTFLLAGLGLVWLTVTQSDARRGERALRGLLPAGGGIAAAATLLGLLGFAVFACGEAVEGRSLGGTPATAIALAAVAVLATFAIRTCVRWLAAAGAVLAALLAALLAWTIGPADVFATSAAVERAADTRLFAAGRHLGRAPPLSA